MSRPGYVPYLPQSEPVRVADDLWVVDGPEIGYRFAGLTLPCPTRMTVMRIGTALWLHSPTVYSADLGRRLAALGTVAWIVAPNSYHYSHVATWATAYPAAACHVSPDVIAKLPPLPDPPIPLANEAPPDWRADLDQFHVDLGRFAETLFFHRASATLIVTDLVQNFEADRIPNPFLRTILRIGGSTGPGGQTSLDVRIAARGNRDRAREALAHMLRWAPQRIILSHGKGYDRDIPATLTRAFH
ncbi:DUF4336 domain-containing protein [Sphingomonas psychrolutea]|uniref:DUF4336 domain-containing protein n=1 Tax=Sphingomonas psychrolutea TaxID=1259676 RepID=A0ABQ1GKT2_9SPHN|nr:DUF4336 domain-containing protein [Sphingomonas psychrolutea]GGA45890.1 hypothetical protein GCM10011395_15160 [Sphingomonas psychrolutea]